jgi:hypothetical protein
MKGDWALQEWYPNYRRKSSTSEGAEDEGKEEGPSAKNEKTATA